LFGRHCNFDPSRTQGVNSELDIFGQIYELKGIIYFLNLNHYVLQINNPILYMRNKGTSLAGWYEYNDLEGGSFENIGRPSIFKDSFKITNKSVPLVIIYQSVSVEKFI